MEEKDFRELVRLMYAEREGDPPELLDKKMDVVNWPWSASDEQIFVWNELFDTQLHLKGRKNVGANEKDHARNLGRKGNDHSSVGGSRRPSRPGNRRAS